MFSFFTVFVDLLTKICESATVMNTSLTLKPYKHSFYKWRVYFTNPDGKRDFKGFKTKSQAEDWLETKSEEISQQKSEWQS